MARAIAFAQTRIPPMPSAGIVRSAIVSGCALALILAGPSLPF